MKNRLNITVDPVLIEQAKRYADKHHISLSQMVEMYFKSIVRPSRKKNIIDHLNELPRPKVKLEETDLKKRYLESRKKKYGF